VADKHVGSHGNKYSNVKYKYKYPSLKYEYKYKYPDLKYKYKYLKFVLEYKYKYQVLHHCHVLYQMKECRSLINI